MKCIDIHHHFLHDSIEYGVVGEIRHWGNFSFKFVNNMSKEPFDTFPSIF